MPNHARYGLFLVILILIALGLPMMAAAAQSADPTPLFTPTPFAPPDATIELTQEAGAILELTTEPETTQEPRQLPGGDRIDPVDAGAINVGDSVDGTLTADEPAFAYTLSGEAGDAVRITLVSEDFDPYLVFEDEDGNLLDTDDDSAGNYDSRISYTLPADGEYRIIAQSFAYYNNSGAATGAYTLSVTTVEVRRIEYTQEISGELTLDELMQDYQFTGEAGDSILIRLNSPTFDTYLSLLDDSGFELLTNDDSGGTLNSQIGPYELPYTGSYSISVNSFSRSATGAYTVSLQKVEMQPLSYGEAVEIEITERSSVYFFNFEANTGEIINIYAEGEGDLNTDLQLTDPYNSTLASDQDSGRRYDPEIIDFVVTTTGTHMIILNVISGTGTVNLTLERGILPSLDEGVQRISFSSTGTNQTRALSFNGTAGQVVSLSFAATTANVTGSPNISVSQNGSSIAYGSSSYVSAMSLEFTVPVDGEVLVSVSEYSYTNITYEVTLAAAE